MGSKGVCHRPFMHFWMHHLWLHSKNTLPKLNPKNINTICGGYGSNTKIGWLWDAKCTKMIVRWDVIFHKLFIFQYQLHQTYSLVCSISRLLTCQPCTPIVFLQLMTVFQMLANHRSLKTNTLCAIQMSMTHQQHLISHLNNSSTCLHDLLDLCAISDPPPTHFQEYYIPHNFASVATTKRIPTDTKTFEDAMRNHDIAAWPIAMHSEFNYDIWATFGALSSSPTTAKLFDANGSTVSTPTLTELWQNVKRDW